MSPYALGWIEGEAGALRAQLQTRIGGLLDDLGLRPADHGLGNLPLDDVGVLLALEAGSKVALYRATARLLAGVLTASTNRD